MPLLQSSHKIVTNMLRKYEDKITTSKLLKELCRYQLKAGMTTASQDTKSWYNTWF